MIKGYARKIKNEYMEPSTNGIDKNKSKVTLYIGVSDNAIQARVNYPLVFLNLDSAA